MAVSHYYFLLGCIWGMSPGAAQTLLVEDNQQFYISENTTVVIQGGVRNQGTFTNWGEIRLTGDWTNEQSYRPGVHSKVTLLDESPQQIDHRNASFRHLLVEGGGPKRLRSNLRVEDTLTLAHGVIVPEASALLTLGPAATVAGGEGTSYVERVMAYEGNGERTFPLGLEGHYLPLVLTDVEDGATTLRVEVVSPNVPATAGNNIERVSTARYWSITPSDGSFAGAVATLTVDGDDDLDDLLGAIVVQADDPRGTFSTLGQSSNAGDAFQGTVTSEEPVTQSVVAVGLTQEFSVEQQVLVPSAFSPEAADPVNRLLKVYAATLLPESFSFRIFDRWGQLVYQTAVLEQAREEGWNGQRSSDQSLAPPGVYQYHLQGVFEGNVPVNQTGTITLFR